jgi:16S rRNA (guanine966-N2)-methyltransferase
VLGHLVDFEDSHVVDAFAGSGSLTFEALSRGAAHGTLLEEGRGALTCIEANAQSLGLRARVSVLAGDAERSLARVKGSPVRVLFVDPPYGLVETEAFARFLTSARGALEWEPDAILVVEHRAGDTVPPIDAVAEESLRTWGDTSVWIGRLVSTT